MWRCKISLYRFCNRFKLPQKALVWLLCELCHHSSVFVTENTCWILIYRTTKCFSLINKYFFFNVLKLLVQFIRNSSGMSSRYCKKFGQRNPPIFKTVGRIFPLWMNAWGILAATGSWTNNPWLHTGKIGWSSLKSFLQASFLFLSFLWYE